MKSKINFPEIVRRESSNPGGYFALRCRLFSAWKQLAKNADLYQIRWEDNRFYLYQSFADGIWGKRIWVREAELPGCATMKTYLE
jgi:hypothetical protein